MFRSLDLLSSEDLQGIFKDPIIIAIDGPTASGKGTLAGRIAQRLDFAYMDTGALYRGVAKIALDKKLDPQKESEAAKAAETLLTDYSQDLQNDPAIRTEDVSRAASQVAAHPKVREILLDVQRNFAKKPPLKSDKGQWRGIVMDGRDIGTVICPDAHIKLFIDADLKVRAKRRAEQLTQKGMDADIEAITQDMKIRDGRDTSRDIAPTLPADDAFIIDTTSLNANEVLERSMDIIRGYLVGVQAALKYKSTS